MGTRGALGFIKGGQHKVTYNHFDSYPSALGQDVLDFIHKHSVEEMNEMFDGIELIKEDAKPTDEQKEKCAEAGVVDLGVSNQSTDDWYCLLRDCQGDLAAIGKVGLMIDSQEFLRDSLFCEYAYVINLDDNVLEVYKGFQKARPEGRYSNVPPNGSGYYGVGLVNRFRLDDCPIDTVDLVPGEED